MIISKITSCVQFADIFFVRILFDYRMSIQNLNTFGKYDVCFNIFVRTKKQNGVSSINMKIIIFIIVCAILKWFCISSISWLLFFLIMYFDILNCKNSSIIWPDLDLFLISATLNIGQNQINVVYLWFRNAVIKTIILA